MRIFNLLIFTLFIFPLSLFSQNVLMIGIAGGSGSGKSTLARNIAKSLEGEVVVIAQDSFYKDLSHLPPKERDEANFDAPDSIDFETFIQCLNDLKKGRSVDIPIYDFVTHTRSKNSIPVAPKKIVLVEGILLFAQPKLRDLLDIKIFIDVRDEERLLRRVKRDMQERGRSLESVTKQYINTVAPMYREHVYPSMQFANIVVPEGGDNKVALQMLITRSKQHLEEIE